MTYVPAVLRRAESRLDVHLVAIGGHVGRWNVPTPKDSAATLDRAQAREPKLYPVPPSFALNPEYRQKQRLDKVKARARSAGLKSKTYEATLARAWEALNRLTLTLAKFGALTAISNDLLRDSSYIGDIIRDDLIKQIALKQDLAFLRGIDGGGALMAPEFANDFIEVLRAQTKMLTPDERVVFLAERRQKLVRRAAVRLQKAA